MRKMSNLAIEKEVKRIFSSVGKELEPELFTDFVTYWVMRKSNIIDSTSTVIELKTLYPNKWLRLIESNHKFRSLYGEEIATRLIELIQNNELD